MPTYVYKCDDGHEFEAVQGIKDDVLTECTVEECAADGMHECGEPCKRLIAGCTFVLKGSGWTGKGGVV
jgi:putative FmdB family regulatory protein